MQFPTCCTPKWIVAAMTAWLGCTSGVLAEEPFAAPKRLAGWAETANETAGAALDGARADSSDCQRKWSLRFIPYGWVPGLHGDLTVRNTTAPVDVSIGRTLDIIFDSLDLAAVGQIEASNGRFGFIFNGLYMDVSPGAQVRNLNFSSDFRTTILDMTATVNLPGVTETLCLPQGSRFEILAGARYVALFAGITVTGPRGNSATGSGTEDWFDPILGARLRVPLGECFTAQVRGDVGGFDLGEASRFTWNVEATLEYRLNDRASILAGYRVLDIDHVNGSGDRQFRFDMNLNGPIMGLAFDF